MTAREKVEAMTMAQRRERLREIEKMAEAGN